MRQRFQFDARGYFEVNISDSTRQTPQEFAEAFGYRIQDAIEREIREGIGAGAQAQWARMVTQPDVEKRS